MHQPFYKDLISGEYKLPWTRLHALKDYYGMVQILEDFPRRPPDLQPGALDDGAGGGVRRGQRRRPVSARGARSPPRTSPPPSGSSSCSTSSRPTRTRMIYRYPALRRTLRRLAARRTATPGARLRIFGAQAFRDLQVLSQLAWFDEEFHAQRPGSPRTRAPSGRNFTLEDQALMGRKQTRDPAARCCPPTRSSPRAGRSRSRPRPSTTPSCRCCAIPTSPTSRIPTCRCPRASAIRRTRARSSSAPRQFCREQSRHGARRPVASEGSVSDEALGIAAESGFQWAATDNGVLSRTLGRGAGVGRDLPAVRLAARTAAR